MLQTVTPLAACTVSGLGGHFHMRNRRRIYTATTIKCGYIEAQECSTALLPLCCEYRRFSALKRGSGRDPATALKAPVCRAGMRTCAGRWMAEWYWQNCSYRAVACAKAVKQFGKLPSVSCSVSALGPLGRVAAHSSGAPFL